ncbi:MAG TPA: ABC-2 family transporter protein, partial [Symbiobacteriaceae bacterium]|nr:ABC-2 family transporter protein [Symbiobacteriaceae bacterium]
MAFYWGLFWSYVAQYAKGRLAYGWDLLAGLISDLTYQSVALIFLVVIFGQVPDLAGWRREEVFFIYGYFLWPSTFFGALSNGIWSFADQYVIKGELDRLLLRPASPLFQLILEGVQLESLLGLISGTVIMFWAGVRLGLTLHWYDPLLLLLLTAGSTLIYLGVYLSLMCISFWYDGRTGILPLLWNVNNYGRYPAPIYNKALRILLTWVLPFAFVGFYPAAYFLRPQAYWLWAAATPLMGIALFGAA